MSECDDRLFSSSYGMSVAKNYNQLIYNIFRSTINGDVLEVGCGIGTFTEKIALTSTCDSVLSIDICGAAVEHCRRNISHAGVKFQHTDLMSVEGQFDTIICMNVLEHIEDDQAALIHLLELLRMGGSLFLLVPAHMWLYNAFDLASGHFRRYCKKDVARLLNGSEYGRNIKLKQWYFNVVGALGYFMTYSVLRKQPKRSANTEIGIFDKVLVPMIRLVEPRSIPFGLSLVCVIEKG